MKTLPVLIGGAWIRSTASEAFTPVDPSTGEPLSESYPVSPWDEIERALVDASAAAEQTRDWPGERFAPFLTRFAEQIEARTDQLVETAHRETGLARQPRLRDVELPRTAGQLRQAAAAARDGSWATPTIDSKLNIRSMFAPIGPVVVMGPNNFPFAFNSVAGGDFAAAIAAGNPVIAKGHPMHPGTTRLLAEAAFESARETGLPPAFVQLIYRTSHADGERLVSHPLVGATGYTGSRTAGLRLKAAADRAGKPIYLELSSINPVFLLPGALEERLDTLADEFTASCLMGAGQFCTNPGLVVLHEGPLAERFLDAVAQRFAAAPVSTMLGEPVRRSLAQGVQALRQAGAVVVCGGEPGNGPSICFQNTLLRTTGDSFLTDPHRLQTEAFGNASLCVVARDAAQMVEVAGQLEGNLTGSIYSAAHGADDSLYDLIAAVLRPRVGRLLNDKMPTGVAVSPAMNHGGPYPATGHPGFTAVGIPASMRRFAMLQCYDNVRPDRLPPALQDSSPNDRMWRLIDGEWTRSDVGG